jgi:hypothetical protein
MVLTCLVHWLSWIWCYIAKWLYAQTIADENTFNTKMLLADGGVNGGWNLAELNVGQVALCSGWMEYQWWL